MLSVYTYPDRYDVKVYYRNGDSINLPCETENEAYAMLYRFVYAPDTLNFKENGEKVTEEEFAKNESKKRWSLKNLFSRKQRSEIKQEIVNETGQKTANLLNHSTMDTIAYKLLNGSVTDNTNIEHKNIIEPECLVYYRSTKRGGGAVIISPDGDGF